MNYTLTDYIAGVRDGSIDPQSVLDYYIAQAQSDTHNYWINITADYAQEHLDQIKDLPLAGAAIAIKDIINIE